MEAGKQPLDFIPFDRENLSPDSHFKKNKIWYQAILNSIPIPISLWELKRDDFYLLFFNKAAKKYFKIEFDRGSLLSKSFPGEYLNVFTSSRNNNLNLRFIDENTLIICHEYQNNNIVSEAYQDNYRRGAFRSIIEPSPISIVITNKSGEIEYVNQKFVEVTGYSSTEVIGKNPRILKSGNTSDQEYKLLWDTILAGNVWKGEFINKRKNGETYYEFAVISSIRNDHGEITNFIGFKEDTTKLKEAENELHKAEKFAELGKMAAYIAHEIKTPLTSIKLNVDILEQSELMDADAKKSFAILQKEIRRLNNLLKNVLQFSTDKQLYFSQINLSKKIESIHEFIKPLLEQHGITLHNRTDGSYIYGDPQQLRSLFIHLLENSIESIIAGGEIDIYSEMQDKECHIYVKDNGCGINNIKEIFEPFYTTKSTGTGLGLPIAKNIAEHHKGILKLVSSRPGETIFEIILPAWGSIGKTPDH